MLQTYKQLNVGIIENNKLIFHPNSFTSCEFCNEDDCSQLCEIKYYKIQPCCPEFNGTFATPFWVALSFYVNPQTGQAPSDNANSYTICDGIENGIVVGDIRCVSVIEIVDEQPVPNVQFKVALNDYTNCSQCIDEAHTIDSLCEVATFRGCNSGNYYILLQSGGGFIQEPLGTVVSKFGIVQQPPTLGNIDTVTIKD